MTFIGIHFKAMYSNSYIHVILINTQFVVNLLDLFVVATVLIQHSIGVEIILF